MTLGDRVEANWTAVPFRVFTLSEVAQDAREAKYMSAFGHPRRNGWGRQADGTRRQLGACKVEHSRRSSRRRDDDLKNVLPLEINIRIGKMNGIIFSWLHYESVLCVDEFLFIPDLLGDGTLLPSRCAIRQWMLLPRRKLKVCQVVHGDV